jgi:3-hydroxybutyryl-CoA dehydrogenase
MPIERIENILVIGAGTMGRQIAWQCATHGFQVALADDSETALQGAKQLLAGFAADAVRTGRFTDIETQAALQRITLTNRPDTTAIDLVSESVYEDPALKIRIFAELNASCPAHTIFTTNSSTLLPSMMASASGRPDRFAALHFHLPVWSANIVDVMGHPGTSPETIASVTDFARRIGQIPIVLKRENSGYVFNDMFNALNTSAIHLVATGVATIEDVDRAWMGIMKMPLGPGGWLDQIGLDTVWRITDFWANMLSDPKLLTNAALLKRYIDAGRLGVKSGAGFYHYPYPAYEQNGFIDGESIDQDLLG